MNNIYVLFGPSGCGKNTVASIMEQQFECEKLVTDTTRKPREGEINHIDYNYSLEALKMMNMWNIQSILEIFMVQEKRIMKHC